VAGEGDVEALLRLQASFKFNNKGDLVAGMQGANRYAC